MRNLPLLGAALLLSLFLGGCDGGSEPPPTAPAPTPPAPVATVQFTGSAPGPLQVGGTVQLQVRTLDGAGNVLGGRPVTWASNAPQVATVSNTGLVMGVAPGEAQITATSEGRSAAVAIRVLPPPVASITLAPEALALEVGDTARFVATLRDPAGNVLEGREVAWSSSDAGVVSVDEEGRITGVGVGAALVTATSEGESAAAGVTVRSNTAPLILGVEPAVLREGETGILSGRRFSPTGSENTLTLGGAQVEILSASETVLTFRVPEGACLPQGPQRLVLAVGGEEAETLHPFHPLDLLDLEPGAFRILRGAAVRCIQLPESEEAGEWLMGVQSVTSTPETRDPLVLDGRPSEGVQAPFGLPFALAARDPGLRERASERGAGQGAGRVVIPGGADLLRPDRDDGLREHWEGHHAHLDRELALATELLARGEVAAFAPVAPSLLSASVQVGDTVPIRIPPFSGNCGQFTLRNVVVREKTARAIVVEDVLNPEPRFEAEDFQRMAQVTDDLIYDRQIEMLGGFTDFDGNNRIVIVVSTLVNGTGFLGYVRATDFFARSSCPASNQGEYFYVMSPSGTAPSTSAFSLEGARRILPRLMVHEAAHIAQFGQRIVALGTTALPSWFLEGQARLAEEITAREHLGLAARGNLDRSVFADPEVDRWLTNRFSELAFYHGYESPTARRVGAPEGCGWLGRDTTPGSISGPCQSGAMFYGVSWSFQRWLSDHYADGLGGEDAMQRAILRLPEVSLPRLGELVGEDYRDLLALWAASQYVDSRFDGVEERLTFPSWNLFDLSQRFVETARLSPLLHGFEPFERALTLAAGSSSYHRLGGGVQPGMALRLRALDGGEAPEHVQLWILRIP